MKYKCLRQSPTLEWVTPYAGVWIEIRLSTTSVCDKTVTPYAGVWIEITSLKFHSETLHVTPYAGVWIEIEEIDRLLEQGVCHSLRGSVD